MFEAQHFDRLAVASRIRGLVAGQDHGDLALTADRLGISELELRLSIDDLSPHPTFEAIAAIVRVLGVDPHWLITGEYDPAAHRAALEAAAERTSRELEELVRRQATPPRPLRIVPEERAS